MTDEEAHALLLEVQLEASEWAREMITLILSDSINAAAMHITPLITLARGRRDLMVLGAVAVTLAESTAQIFDSLEAYQRYLAQSIARFGEGT